ncbi:MAG TPA: hypothetical protein VKV41_22230 [Methylomirabilota bacterium]|jgi:hypothetical protein|nr:hypothetical protein [Methylomirabilota bacterium]
MEAADVSVNTIARVTAQIVCSRELVAQTHARLGDTRALIALNRRWLNPWWGLSGSSDHDAEGTLLQSVLDRLQRGVLVPVPSRVGAAKGTGQVCSICAQTIYPDEVENEVAVNGGGLTVRLWAHTGCLAIWRRASEVYAQRQPSPTDGHAD